MLPCPVARSIRWTSVTCWPPCSPPKSEIDLRLDAMAGWRTKTGRAPATVERHAVFGPQNHGRSLAAAETAQGAARGGVADRHKVSAWLRQVAYYPRGGPGVTCWTAVVTEVDLSPNCRSGPPPRRLWVVHPTGNRPTLFTVPEVRSTRRIACVVLAVRSPTTSGPAPTGYMIGRHGCRERERCHRGGDRHHGRGPGEPRLEMMPTWRGLSRFARISRPP
jgi:hypothetical protein